MYGEHPSVTYDALLPTAPQCATDRWVWCGLHCDDETPGTLRRMNPEHEELIDDAWVVRAAVTGGRMPYSRTRRSDVDHPFHAVATHRVDLGDTVQRVHALSVLLGDGAAISHVTAAVVRGFPVPRALGREPALHGSVPRPRRAPRIAGVHGHSIELDSAHVEQLLVVAPSTGELLPVPLVDEPLTLLTCATRLARPDLVALADAMLMRATVEGRLDPMLAALRYGERRPGYARLVRAAPLRRAGVRSRAETLLRLMIASAGLPEPVVAHPVQSTPRSPESWKAEADLAWPQFGVIVEYEGDGHRTSRRQFAKDVRRFERYADEGWRAVRATQADVFDDPRELMSRLERRLREGGWRPHSRWRRRPVMPAVA